MEAKEDEMLSAEDVRQMKSLCRNICRGYLDKYVSSADKEQCKMTLCTYYSIIFSEKLESKNKKKGRPESERVYEDVSVEKLEKIRALESKIRQLSSSINAAKCVFIDKNGTVINIVDDRRDYHKKVASVTKLVLPGNSTQNIPFDRANSDSQLNFNSEVEVLNWIDEYINEFESSFDQLNHLSSLIDNTEKKVANLAIVATSRLINPAVSKEKLPINDQSAKFSNWGFSF